MWKVIVAFENGANAVRIKEVLESSGDFSCVVCRSAAGVKRTARKLRVRTVVCGFKLADQSCEDMYHDLPEGCSMLMVAPQTRLELCETESVFKLQTPVRRGELLASVRMLAQFQRTAPRERGKPHVQRSEKELALVARAKAVLMDRHGMTEEQAHRFLQKQSMDAGAKLTDTAKLILSQE